MKMPSRVRSANFGIFFKNQAKYDRAKPFYDRALTGQNKVQGPNHPSTLLTRTNRGDLLRLMGEVAAAETDLLQALPGLQKVNGERHQWTLYTVACLALLLAQQGRTEEAAAVYADALQGAPLGPQIPVTKENVAELSRLLDERGDGGAAAQLRQRFGCEG